MSGNNSSKNNEPRMGKTFRDDLHKVRIKDDLSGEYADLKEYFLTDDRKEQLKLMSRFKKSSSFRGGYSNHYTLNLLPFEGYF